jgi:outer membrane receptor protein involved in Fe transport
MRTISRSICVAGMSAIACTSVWVPSQSATGAELEEITVTARKQEESLQDVPISIQAIQRCSRSRVRQ